MKNRDSFRGTSINETFAATFKKSRFYKDIYAKHKDEIIIGVRDGFINLYYNCDSIAKIDTHNPSICRINKYYTHGEKECLTGDEIVHYFDIIKESSDKRTKLEKQAQQRLFIDNNNNLSSEWFCLDVEYTKSLQGKLHAEDWRFDIIAISKEKPFRVALIELKYGSGAIGGESGITKHIQDYYKFHKENSFELLKPELISIINSLKMLGVEVPKTLQSIKIEDFMKAPEYYFITLSNKKVGRHALPMETMAGYLFTKAEAETNGDWKAIRYSKNASKKGYYATVGEDKSFKPIFFFSDATLPELGINDILYEGNYVKKNV